MKIIDYALRLLVVCVFASGILAYVYQSTAARIEENSINDRLLKVKNLLPPDTARVEEASFNNTVFFKGFTQDGRRSGVVIESSAKGYGGAITALVAVNDSESVTDLAIISHNETPGLGSKVDRGSFLDQFKGRTARNTGLKKDTQGPDGIDAIAAATISSRAVANAVREALEKYKEVKGAGQI